MNGLNLLLRVAAAVALVYLVLVFVDAATTPPAKAVPVSCSAAEWDTCA